MLRSPLARAVAVVVLLAGLVGLGVWFGSLSPAPGMGAYPGAEQLGRDYGAHVGDRVELTGRAVATDPVVVRVRYDGGILRLTVTGLDRGVDAGDLVWVYGVVEPDRRIDARDGVVISPWELRYGRGVSLLAGAWVLGRVLRDWRVDREACGLAPAGGRDADGSGARGEGGGDA